MTPFARLLLALSCFVAASAHAHPDTVPGILLRPDARFDPSVQRWLAERSLKLLPLHDGAFYYVIPVDTDPYFEEQQIRYLESLLDEESREPDHESK